MSRAVRVDIEGCWYHVVARGNERRRIFSDEKERRYYLGLLDEIARLSGSTFCAYSLVPNHVHLLICRGRRSLASMIQRLHGNYAAYFNRRHRRKGHLFEGRYHAYLVTDEKYLNALIRYIHRNLPEAGLEVRNHDPLWSSHRLYLKADGRPWTNWRPAPGYEERGGIRAYRQLMGDTAEDALPPLVPERPWAYGTANGWKKFERRRVGRAGKRRREKRGIEPLKHIVERVSKYRQVAVRLLKSASRQRKIAQVRSEAILNCLAVGHGPTEISRYFLRRPASVTTIVRRYGDPRKNKLINIGLTPTRPNPPDPNPPTQARPQDKMR